MLQAHSLLWHYLWVAPNILLLVFGFVLKKRGFIKQFPVFVAFACFSAVGELTVYCADVIPSIGPWTYWRVEWASLLVTGLLKFVLVSEIFALVFGPYASVAKLGKVLIRAIGVALVFTAAVLAAYASPNSRFGIISGSNLLSQAIYLIESGLLVFIFFFAFYFRLTWQRALFGIALGLSLSSCIHLATFALIASGGVLERERLLFTFLNMTTYHLCVLIWMYFLLVPSKAATKPAVPLPEHNLEVWNRELERLLQQ
jgi:hypothetical protein